MQEAVTFDYGDLIREPTTGFKLYILFLLIACLVTSVKLIRVWKAVPPFRSPEKTNNPHYAHLLYISVKSLKQWMVSVILSYGLLLSTNLYSVCRDVLNDNRVGGATLFFVIKDYSAGLTMALLVASFAFLTRWYLLRRIERLESRQLTDS